MADSRTDQITGVILAGGRGQRMDGVDKGLQMLHGKPLVAHVLERLQPQVSWVVINANRNAGQYEKFGHPVIADLVTDYVGPLAGLHAALSAATTDLVLTVPCDSPYLPHDLASRLLAAINIESTQIAVASVDTQTQPVFCLARRDSLASLADYLAAGGRKMNDWQTSLHARHVDFQDQADAFRNINSPADLAQFG